MRLTIRYRLWLGFGLMILITAGAYGSVWWMACQSDRQMADFTGHGWVIRQSLQRARHALTSARVAEQYLLRQRDLESV